MLGSKSRPMISPVNAHDSGVEIEADIEHDIFLHVDFADSSGVLLALTYPQLRLVIDGRALCKRRFPLD